MNYVENIFICLGAPILVAVMCTRGKVRLSMSFVLFGMVACLLSSYITAFVAVLRGADALSASLEIAPLVEEVMKLLPMLFYLIVFNAGKEAMLDGIIMTALGFATFENVCFLTGNGVDDLYYLAIRGFGTGAMHVVCGNILAIGLLRTWSREWLRAAGTVVVLITAVAFHGTFNVMVSQNGPVRFAGFAIPLAAAVASLVLKKRLYPKEINDSMTG